MSSSTDLTTYIKKQLSTLLSHVKQTPPKRSSSLKRISRIVQNSSQIPKAQKQSINKSIQRVQSAISRSVQLQRIKDKSQSKSKFSSPYEKHLFYDNMILEEKVRNTTPQVTLERKNSTDIVGPASNFIELVQKFQDLRGKRLKQENLIQSLSLKAQKLERLLETKKVNDEKYLQSLKISEKYKARIQKLTQIKDEIKTAASHNKKKTMSLLMKKFADNNDF